MELKSINLEPEYLVNTSGTSDGTQDKYFKNGIWYKSDRFGGEGEAEHLVSLLLSCSSLSTEEYVYYDRILINGTEGCCSKNFLRPEESFVTVYRLYSNTHGGDIAQKLMHMDYDDAIDFVIRFIKEQTGLDFHRYLANIFKLDQIILNEDRNFNNFGVVFDGKHFREAPVFDNGKSLFVGNKNEDSASCFAKSFSGSFELNFDHLKKYSDLEIDVPRLKEALIKEPESHRRELLLERILLFNPL